MRRKLLFSVATAHFFLQKCSACIDLALKSPTEKAQTRRIRVKKHLISDSDISVLPKKHMGFHTPPPVVQIKIRLVWLFCWI